MGCHFAKFRLCACTHSITVSMIGGLIFSPAIEGNITLPSYSTHIETETGMSVLILQCYCWYRAGDDSTIPVDTVQQTTNTALTTTITPAPSAIPTPKLATSTTNQPQSKPKPKRSYKEYQPVYVLLAAQDRAHTPRLRSVLRLI